MIRKLALFLILFFTFSVSTAQNYTLYKVKRKATVETVAFLNDITPEQLLLANPTLNPQAKLRPGTIVKIPVTAPEQEPAEQEPTEQEPAEPIESDLQPSVPASDTLIAYNPSSRRVRIAAILPFENPKLAQSMCEIYSGMVIAASDVSKKSGTDIIISAYSTSDLSDSNLDAMLSDKDVIVGPVYRENFEIVAKWASEHKIPVVSPLMSFDAPDNPYVVMMPPTADSKTAPLKDYLTSDRNVILVQHSQYPDKSQTEEFLQIAPYASKFAYSRENVSPQEFMPLIDPTRLNVFLVPTEHQGAIEDVVSKITALNSPVKLCDIAIVGMPSWLNLSNFSPTILFRGNVSCVSSYYFDRHNDVMTSFFDEYINAFEKIPTRFVLRGYDIVDIMAGALSTWGEKALTLMDNKEFIPLMNPYRFVRNTETGNLCNDRWVLVTFRNNYSVDIK